MLNKVTVRATRDFCVGPYRQVVIKKGAIRQVQLSDNGFFSTETNDNLFFGFCYINDGWEIVNQMEQNMNNQMDDNNKVREIRAITTNYYEVVNSTRYKLEKMDLTPLLRNRQKIEYIRAMRILTGDSLEECKKKYEFEVRKFLKYPIMIKVRDSYYMVRSVEKLDWYIKGKIADVDTQYDYEVIEENVKLTMAPSAMQWCIFDNDTQTTIGDGFDCFEEANNVLPALPGGNYNIYCIPMGMEVVKTTSYKEGVSEISYTVQDKKEQ